MRVASRMAGRGCRPLVTARAQGFGVDRGWRPGLPGDVRGAEAPKVVKKHQADLRRELRGLRLDPPGFRDDPPAAAHLDGTAWRLEANEAGLRGVSFLFHPGRLVVSIQARRKTVLRCGAGKWVPGRMRRERRAVPPGRFGQLIPGPATDGWRRPCDPSPRRSWRPTRSASRAAFWIWSSGRTAPSDRSRRRPSGRPGRKHAIALRCRIPSRPPGGLRSRETITPEKASTNGHRERMNSRKCRMRLLLSRWISRCSKSFCFRLRSTDCSAFSTAAFSPGRSRTPQRAARNA